MKINPPSKPQDWEGSGAFESAEQAAEAIEGLLPNFRCVACGFDKFQFLEEYGDQHRTGSLRYRFPQVEPRTVDLTVSISCERCGYVMAFVEEKLKQLKVVKINE